MIKYVESITTENDTIHVNIKQKKICEKICTGSANEYLVDLVKSGYIQKELDSKLKIVDFKIHFHLNGIVASITEYGLELYCDKIVYEKVQLMEFYQNIVDSIKTHNKIVHTDQNLLLEQQYQELKEFYQRQHIMSVFYQLYSRYDLLLKSYSLLK